MVIVFCRWRDGSRCLWPVLQHVLSHRLSPECFMVDAPWWTHRGDLSAGPAGKDSGENAMGNRKRHNVWRLEVFGPKAAGTMESVEVKYMMLRDVRFNPLSWFS